MTIIKSVSKSQVEIIQNIVDLHTGPIQADVTFGAGCFYKKLPRPELCFDLEPRPGQTWVRQADVRHLPLPDATVRTVMFDPPFLPRTGSGSLIKSRFGAIEGGIKGLGVFYGEALYELHRVLKPKGWLIFKCQDLVSGGKNHFIHCDIRDAALRLGFEAIDLIILKRERVLPDPQGRPQKHVRKVHCYFWVLQKRPR